MYKAVNVDAVVEQLKNIVDCTRCPICDRVDGTRMRYVCGHTSCEDCVVLAVDCSVCLTPPEGGAIKPEVDKPFTQRAADAVNLLNVFQNEFHIDVYKRHRISEQLKVEKELFPECIQAPAKYFNKRKSYQNSKLDKENRLSQLPGEEVSSFVDHKMDKRNENVELWLNRFVRKPFAELNSNNDTLRNNTRTIKKQQHATNNENIELKRSNKKRSHAKIMSPVTKNQSSIPDHLTPEKKMKIQKKESKLIKNTCIKPNTSKYSNTGTDIKVTDTNESGIEMDDEAVVIIDDSQSVKIDKDIQAWLAVQEAERNKQYDTASESLLNSRSFALKDIPTRDKTIEAVKVAKVPFYLKGCLSNKSMSNLDVPESMIKPVNNKSDVKTKADKDVSITVESKSFITVINIRQLDNKQIKDTNCMQSVEVQTDSIQRTVVNENDNNDRESQSQLLFQDELNKEKPEDMDVDMKCLNKSRNVVILESDSDEDVEASLSLEVTAEVHRSCDEVDYGILADVNDLEEHSRRARRGQRGVTPTSTNSSEKENYNPNKMRRPAPPTSKKKPMKK